MENFDVAIIGAGPAGSATAIGLALRGYEVALIDKKYFPREKLCGDFVNPINWAVFRELGVEDRVLAQPHSEVTGFRITTAAGDDAAAQFTSSRQERVFGLGIRRAHLDQVLLGRAVELGVTVRQGKRIDNLSQTAHSWMIDCGKESRRAKILIGADGRNSWVAQRLGMSNRAAMRGRSVGFQCRLNYAGAIGGKVEIHLFPGGYAGVVAFGDGTINLCLAVDKRMLPRERSGKFLFTEIFPRNPYLNDIIQRSESVSALRSVYPVYFPSRRSIGDRALLVGDAARVSEPVTGEGIYFALRSGLLAAETIDLALRKGHTAAPGLADYERLCRRAFRSRLALNTLIRFAIYRPALLDPLIRLSAKNDRMLHSLVGMVCMPDAAR
ncbi:MAG: NAD(P)/FAD-dependent oxidoreductase [Candidatus Binatia bacterium]